MPVPRRDALLLLAAATLALRPGRAALLFHTQEVAPGLHVRQGVHEEATPANANAIANIGFFIGAESVAVIDPGGSQPDGERLRARIRELTPLPIRYVIMTHLHPDHVFGAAAFEQDQPIFIAHARMAGMLVERGEFYRNRLADILGLDAAGDYAKPTRLVSDQDTIDLGHRPLHLHAHPTAHTDNDLSILDPTTATLWAGDLLFVDRVPALDGSLLGWQSELDAMATWPARRAIPGHGPASVPWPEAATAQRRYLATITRDVRVTIARGGDIETAVATAGQSERDRWQLFDEYNGRNVTTAYKELEWE